MAKRAGGRTRIQIRDLDSVSATDAKNRFGELLHKVVYGQAPVLIERNGRPMAVLVDIEQYLALKRASRSTSKEPPFSSES